jgi:cytidine deaminase
MNPEINEIHLELLEMAQENQQNAYSKYSNFPVGACLVSNNGDIYHGFNIENVSFGLTNCAERTALFHALASGEKPGDFQTIAITADTPEPICPCGACLQVMLELGGPELNIVMGNSDLSKVRVAKLKELMPFAFSNTEKFQIKEKIAVNGNDHVPKKKNTANFKPY